MPRSSISQSALPQQLQRKPKLLSSSGSTQCERSSRPRPGSSVYAERQLRKCLDAAFLPAEALVAADDILVGLFDNPLAGLRVRTMGKAKPKLTMQERSLFKARFDSTFRRTVDSPALAVESFVAYAREHKMIPFGENYLEAFSNLAVRYAQLRYSEAVQVCDIVMNNITQICVRAKTAIPRGTILYDLGGIMSAEEVEVFNFSSKNQSKTRRPKDGAPAFETFSVIWRTSAQTGPGPDKDRLLIGPIRFVNHSCVPNSMLWAFPKTSAWGIKTVKDLQPGEEITVQYSASYFLPGECACLACRPPLGKLDHATPATSRAASAVVEEHFDEISKEKKRRRVPFESDDDGFQPPKRTRIEPNRL